MVNDLTPDDMALVTMAQHLGLIDLDPYTAPCPACGQRQLRNEVRVEFRSIADAARAYEIPEVDMRAALEASPIERDAFGRIKVGVPYLTCMACGRDWDGSRAPDEQQ